MLAGIFVVLQQGVAVIMDASVAVVLCRNGIVGNVSGPHVVDYDELPLQ
jgi:hypothetical protein